MRYQIKKPSGQRLYFVVDSQTAEVKARLRTFSMAETTCQNWNDREQDRIRELFSVNGLKLIQETQTYYSECPF